MDLSRRDDLLRELMDDPDCDPERLHATLRRFGIVNRVVSGWDTVYRRHLRPVLAGLGRPARVLDLGSGGGDVIARLAGLAVRDRLAVHWTGADPDPRAHRAACAREVPGATFVCADAETLLSRGEAFDVVISNHVLHHLEAPELVEFTGASRALSSGVVLHNDIARSRRAYWLYAAGITPLAPGTFLRVDGLRSIRRSHRREELATHLGPEWTVTSPAPFRLLAEASGHA
ncbi:methyltransferase domain-containing protein [Nesterenkonia xinjiangensis]|uniref:2-polyprenyl-3-methyl-5-hydroxy-6-metoxy-1, 4-benzoquinol methylase n=1 Tax=Nesterenkonia xinjiangensis TaxID=225327 RepID=A0A7Z0GKS2_9MICC|nr:methyltransferase domain-containing protein [Nesterenkonia xinjiangensis]NYJ77755.1 2-polyprenyl-3-methyl-5-hydroxy-6-metoxy-1,4-benzoquinol methylase [Nesterenkonia xinjiangensis]